ncbi:MAG: FAD-dependent oxidoreductase [Peptococcaceae bacterium]|jgi:hypothetical protein|nr:FAD-dependent oxidoreductase [Peptococcaceae bacterium]
MTEDRLDSFDKIDLAEEALQDSYAPEHSSDKGSRGEGPAQAKKLIPRKGRAIVAILLAFAILASTLYITPFVLWRPVEEITWVNAEIIATDYDVIVLGAEPEGIAAAVTSARNGMKTLLLESSPVLGGLMTLGQLNFLDMCYDRDGTQLTKGFFDEFYRAVGGTAFDVTEAKNYFIDVVSLEPLLTLRTESYLIDAVMEGDTITGVRMLENGQIITYSAQRIIDATADGDLAAMAGASYTIGGEDVGDKDRQMGVTLIFELSGVNWLKVFTHLNANRVLGRIAGNPVNVGATNKSAWGYEEEGFSYVPYDPLMRLRGFNIARQRKGTVLVNALLIFGIDPLDQASCLSAIDRVKSELVRLLPYIRENFAGFEHAELASTASQLYVRESRHFIGEYQLSIDDVLGNRDQWDKIVIGSYPADVQPSAQQPYGTVIGNPDRYAIPFRCLIPLKVDNLLIASRSASYTSLAASSARVLPIGMCAGQAAGTAAALSIQEGLGFREMSRKRESIASLQAVLKAQGAYLEDFVGADPNAGHWAFAGLSTLRRFGLMDGGYRNDYRLEDPVDKWRFQYMINGVIKNAGYSIGYIEVSDPPSCGQILDAVTTAYVAAEELREWADLPVDPSLAAADDSRSRASGGRSFGENRALLADAGLLDTGLQDAGLLDAGLDAYFADPMKVPQAAEVAMLLSNLYNHIAIPN